MFTTLETKARFDGKNVVGYVRIRADEAVEGLIFEVDLVTPQGEPLIGGAGTPDKYAAAKRADSSYDNPYQDYRVGEVETVRFSVWKTHEEITDEWTVRVTASDGTADPKQTYRSEPIAIST